MVKKDIKRRILLVEDTASLAQMYRDTLQEQGYDVQIATTGQDAKIHALQPFDLILLDIKLPDISGLDVMRQIHTQKGRTCPIVVMTGNGSLATAIEAMKLGAQDFLVKPFQPEKLRSAINHVLLEVSNDVTLTKTLYPAPSSSPEKSTHQNMHQNFIGQSKAMRRVLDIIHNASKSAATVFITGESGTGKEVCAHTIHQESKRHSNPFIAINCAALPKDLMESELFGHTKGAFTDAVTTREGAVSQANGGTLFLDEIGEMPLEMQTKLLRFLQNGSFTKIGGTQAETTDARIICATNRDPLKEVEAGRFREDLYYRLHVLPIHMPPLRVRGEDIIEIAHYFLGHFNKEEGKSFQNFSTEALSVIQSHDWPGNIRQLQNIIRHCVVMYEGEAIESHMLSLETPLIKQVQTVSHNNTIDIKPLRDVEKDAILYAVEVCQGNIPKAAALLDVSPSTLYRKKAGWETFKN